ncbi:MAG: hypothetical protein AB1631_34690, partial [Acidobacteriota bacterium]
TSATTWASITVDASLAEDYNAAPSARRKKVLSAAPKNKKEPCDSLRQKVASFSKSIAIYPTTSSNDMTS